jgi:selenide,water dikinase
LARAGLLTSGDKTNREYVGAEVEVATTVDPNLMKLFYDPQTAGGLLLAISVDRAEELLTGLRENYPQAEIIGRVSERGPKAIVIK